MPTPAQEAFAAGFAALAEVHGQTWTFGAASFAGVFSSESVPDGLGGRIAETALLVEVASLGTIPTEGAIATCVETGAKYRVREIRPSAPGQLQIILASEIR